MNIQLMEYYRKSKGYTYDKISELSGIPVETVQKIFKREIAEPDHKTLQALEGVLKPKEYPVNDHEEHPGESAAAVSEGRTVYRAEKRLCTLDDYYALPDDHRMELIDGVFYDMAAPTTGHQMALSQLYMQIANFIDRKRGRCQPFFAPVDVQLDCDDKTMVEPDIIIVCDRNKITRKCIAGAPDLVIEVLSESTRGKDMYLKLHKYEAAGVREYWMIDIEKRKVIVYLFEKDSFPIIYNMEGEIPVGIYEGELRIDFSRVAAKLTEIGQ